MALFEVWQGKQCVMSTNSEACIYDKDTLLRMKSAGYSFRYNGKPFNPKGTARRAQNEKNDIA